MGGQHIPFERFSMLAPEPGYCQRWNAFRWCMVQWTGIRRTLRHEACNKTNLRGQVNIRITLRTAKVGRPDTFLPFMKYRWTGMVYASFIRIGELSTTTLVHALVGHCKASYWHTVKDGRGRYCVQNRVPTYYSDEGTLPWKNP